MNLFDKQLHVKLEERKSKGLLRKLKNYNGLVDLSSNDFLGLATNNQSGATGSRLISGNFTDFKSYSFVSNDNNEFIKISEPYFDKKLKEIDLNFYLIEKRKGKKRLFTEKHFMRSYNPNELFKILKLAGFKKMFAYEWLSNKNVNKNNWNACIVARN